MSTEPTQEAAFFSTIRSWGIVRSDQRVMGGVLGGVGKRIGMAPAPARIIFAVLALLTGGLALLVYAAAWGLLPDAQGSIVIQDFGRGRPNVGALVMIGVLTIFGLIFLDHNVLRTGWGAFNVTMPAMSSMGYVFPHALGVLAAIVIPLALLAGLVLLIVWAIRSSNRSYPAATGFARLPDGTIPEAPAPAAAPATAAATATTADAVVTRTPEPAPASGFASEAAPPVYSAPFNDPAPPVYTAPPRSPRPRVPGPGKVGYLLALAWIPLTAAITLYLATSRKLAVFPVVAAGVIFVAGLGVILIITALRGRKLGFLGFVSVIALIPVGFAIAYAPDLREHYASGDWRDWVHSQGIGNQDFEPEPIYTPSPAFDASKLFLDYETVAINGSCFPQQDLTTEDVQGTVRLSSVPADQSITVTSPATRLVVPAGTSLKVVDGTSPDFGTAISVYWPDRDVACDVNSGATDAVQLTNSDSPVLTVRLEDAQQMGMMTLWIEED